MHPIIVAGSSAAEFLTDEDCFIRELCNDERLDPQLSIAQARVCPGVTTRWHRLHSITERYVLTAGTGLVEVGDLPPQPVGVGDVVLIPPGCRQRITCTSAEDLVFLAICTPPFRIDAYEDIDPAPRD